MKTLHIISLALAVLVCGIVPVAYAEAPRPGNILVVAVKGDVSVTIGSAGVAQPLGKGAFVQQGQIIKTGKGATAELLMSNGAKIAVDQNSSFSVDEFVQAPFDSTDMSYKDLKAEPSTSQTRLSVTAGSIIADVAKLGKGSTFKIGTPSGVAEIRGTLIQVTVTTTAGGQISVTVNLPEGLADFASTSGQQVTLANGQTVTVTADPVTGTLSLSGVSPLNAQTIQQIQSLAEEVAAAIPAQRAFEGVSDNAPEQLGGGTDDNAGGLGGDQGAGDVGTALGGGTGGGGSGGGGGGGFAYPPPSPTPNPPAPTPTPAPPAPTPTPAPPAPTPTPLPVASPYAGQVI